MTCGTSRAHETVIVTYKKDWNSFLPDAYLQDPGLRFLINQIPEMHIGRPAK